MIEGKKEENFCYKTKDYTKTQCECCKDYVVPDWDINFSYSEMIERTANYFKIFSHDKKKDFNELVECFEIITNFPKKAIIEHIEKQLNKSK